MTARIACKNAPKNSFTTKFNKKPPGVRWLFLHPCIYIWRLSFFDFNFFGVPVFVDCLKPGVANTARRGIAFPRTRIAPARYTKIGSHICHYAQSIISYFSINNDFTGTPLILSEFSDTILLISVYL